MAIAYQVSTVLSILLFLYYGSICLFSAVMAAEFERFGVPRLRIPIGILEILGALGLIVGYVLPPLTIASSGGLALLMAAVVFKRVLLRDPPAETFPAAVLLLVNLYILLYAAGALPPA